MSLLDRLGFHKAGPNIPVFGGDVRQPVMGPQAISASLGRLASIRTFLTAVIVVVALSCLGLAIRTPTIMATELFVADGSALGCHVQSYDAGAE